LNYGDFFLDNRRIGRIAGLKYRFSHFGPRLLWRQAQALGMEGP